MTTIEFYNMVSIFKNNYWSLDYKYTTIAPVYETVPMSAISIFTYTKSIRCNKAKLFSPFPGQIFDYKK